MAATETQSRLEAAVDCHRHGRLAEAEALYLEVLTDSPDHAGALHMLGVVRMAQGAHEQALALIDRALAAVPGDGGMLYNRGLVLANLGRHADAAASYTRAIAVNPGNAQAYNNRSNALREIGEFRLAIDSAAKAIALSPDYALAHYNKALCHLTLGEFDPGWALYEWRWKAPALPLVRRELGRPLWLGDGDIAGRTVLLHAEQGYGDALQFCRYAALVAARGARVVLEVDAQLVEVMGTLEGVAQVVACGAPLPAFDCHCPLMSLPLAFGTRLDTIPAPARYLHSDPAQRARWAARLGPKTRPRIGLAWSGNHAHQNDGNRSIPVELLAAVIGDGFDYVSLQKDVRDTDAGPLGRLPIRHFGAEMRDFADTAALCDLVDLVIAVDTSVAHLAGALGRPLWLLLPFNADWRWLQDTAASPWYPTARLLRRGRDEAWPPLLARVAATLGSGRT